MILEIRSHAAPLLFFEVIVIVRYRVLVFILENTRLIVTRSFAALFVINLDLLLLIIQKWETIRNFIRTVTLIIIAILIRIVIVQSSHVYHI